MPASKILIALILIIVIGISYYIINTSNYLKPIEDTYISNKEDELTQEQNFNKKYKNITIESSGHNAKNEKVDNDNITEIKPSHANSNEDFTDEQQLLDTSETISEIGTNKIVPIESFGTIEEFLRRSGGCAIIATVPSQYRNITAYPGETIIVSINITFIKGFSCGCDKLTVLLRHNGSLSPVYIPIKNIDPALITWEIFNVTENEIVILSKEFVRYNQSQITISANSSIIINVEIVIPSFIIKDTSLRIHLISYPRVISPSPFNYSSWIIDDTYIYVMVKAG